METDEIVMILRGQKGDPDFNFYARGDIAPLITSATLNAAADLLESQQARITELEAQLLESQRRERAAVEERDTMMRRHSNQVEVVRQRIDAGGLSCEEIWLLRELMFETRYDRRGPQEAGEGGQ